MSFRPSSASGGPSREAGLRFEVRGREQERLGAAHAAESRISRALTCKARDVERLQGSNVLKAYVHSSQTRSALTQRPHLARSTPAGLERPHAGDGGDTGGPQRQDGCRSAFPGAPAAPQRQPSCPSTVSSAGGPRRSPREVRGSRFEAESESEAEVEKEAVRSDHRESWRVHLLVLGLVCSAS